MKENDIKNTTNKIIISLALVTVLLVGVVIASFATFTRCQETSKDNNINTGTISMTYTEDNNAIKIQNAMPITDAVGKKLSGSGEYFDFTITSDIEGDATVMYEVSAIKDKSSTIADSEVKLYLEKQNQGTYSEILKPQNYTPVKTKTEIGSPKGAMVLVKTSHSSSQADNYRFRMWIDEKAVITDTNKNYTVKINVYGKAK